MPAVWTLTVLVQLLALPALGEPGSFSPARFKQGAESLAAAIVLPRDDPAERTEVTVNCEARASRRGALRDNHCFVPDDAFDEYLGAIARGVREVMLEPATVDGETKQVLFQYSVTFRRGPSGETVEVFPHHGGVRYSQGKSFSSPQRYHEPPSRWGRFCRLDRPAALRIHVGASGDPVRFELLGEVSQNCARSLKRFLDGSRYIPAVLNGVPVASSYEEVFWVSPPPSRGAPPNGASGFP